MTQPFVGSRGATLLALLGWFALTTATTPACAYNFTSGFSLHMGQDMKTGTAGELEFDSGNAFRLTFGNVVEALRFEYELFYRTLNADRLNPPSAPSLSASGDLTQTGLSLNFYERLIGLEVAGITPFWGVGLGGSLLSANSITAGSRLDVDESAAVFNYQFMLGMEYAVGNGFDLAIDYRWVDFGSTSMENRASTNSIQLSPEAAPELGIHLRYVF